MIFGNMRSIFLGSEASEALREIPLIISVLYYSLTIVIARLLRTSIRKTLPQPYQNIAADMVMTFAGCACSLENQAIRHEYGFAGYSVILFVLATWFSLTVRDGSRGNPCGNMISFMQGEISWLMTIVRITFQLVGGLASYQYARYFWYLGLTKEHCGRYTQLHCSSALTVSTPMGFAIEFSSVFVDALLAMTTFTPFFIVELASKQCIAISMIIGGFFLTGMYMNPVNASNQTFLCEGTSVAEHILVYWVGPLLAATLAVIVHRHFSAMVKTFWKTGQKDLAMGDFNTVPTSNNGTTNHKDVRQKKANPLNGNEVRFRSHVKLEKK